LCTGLSADLPFESFTPGGKLRRIGVGAQPYLAARADLRCQQQGELERDIVRLGIEIRVARFWT
jgi:hypothetical protein